MCVNGLWAILQTIRKARTHAELCVHEGFMLTGDTKHALTIGVDAEDLISVVKAQLRDTPHPTNGRNPILKTLFYILCHFGRIPAVLVFVFDGPHKPKRKNGAHVVQHELLLVDFFKDLIDVFGFHHRQASGDSKKELSDLQRLGRIDVIWTEDSGIWMYGATQVVRRADEKTFYVYTAREISRCLQLSNEGMLLFALVIGGDHHEGLAGADPQLAFALAKSELSLELANIIATGWAVYNIRTRDWRQKLVNLLAAGALGQRYVQVAHNVPLHFPDQRLVSLYAHAPSSIDVSEVYAFEQRPINVPGILAQCVLRFGWDTYDRLYNLTVGKVWGAACVRQLTEDNGGVASAARKNTADFVVPGDASIVQRLFTTRASGRLPLVMLRIDASLFHLAVSGAISLFAMSYEQREDTVTVTVPLAIAEYALPMQVSNFLHSATGKRQMKKVGYDWLDEYDPVLDATILTRCASASAGSKEKSPSIIDLTDDGTDSDDHHLASSIGLAAVPYMITNGP